MFELRIEGIDDFKEFVRILRNEDKDDELLFKEASELRESSGKLRIATNTNTGDKA